MDGVNAALFNAASNVQQAMTQNIAVMSNRSINQSSLIQAAWPK